MQSAKGKISYVYVIAAKYPNIASVRRFTVSEAFVNAKEIKSICYCSLSLVYNWDSHEPKSILKVQPDVNTRRAEGENSKVDVNPG